jgi:hypothetical protein
MPARVFRHFICEISVNALMTLPGMFTSMTITDGLCARASLTAPSAGGRYDVKVVSTIPKGLDTTRHRVIVNWSTLISVI